MAKDRPSSPTPNDDVKLQKRDLQKLSTLYKAEQQRTQVSRVRDPRTVPASGRAHARGPGRALAGDRAVAGERFSRTALPPKMGTKAENLAQVAGRLKSAEVLPLVACTVAEWRHDAEGVIAKVQATLPGAELVVRSSARAEDTYEQSNAGAFESRLGVPNTASALRNATEIVIASYGDAARDDDQILVQPHLTDVDHCGVVFSSTLVGESYFVVESDSSGKTDVVTGGASGSNVMFVRHGAPLQDLPLHAAGAIALVAELQTVLRHQLLDVEYATNTSGQVFLLQYRPLVAASKHELAAAAERAFQAARAQVAEIHKQAVGLLVLSDMSDWNPAELIGGRPRPLAVSLFDHVITEKTWSAARARLGYHRPVGVGLLKVIAAHPYIDVRASAMSLLPRDLAVELRNVLADDALGFLTKHPELHDKIEFCVVPSAYTPSFDETFARYAEIFPATELDQIRGSIRKLTETLILGGSELVADLMAEINEVDAARASLLEGVGDDPLGAVEVLVRDARERSFEVFGAIARLAFIGAAFLRGLVEVEAIKADRAEDFLRSLRTVAGELAEAMDAYANGKLDLKALLEQFGHLRPSSFDVTSPRYDEAPKLYLDGAQAHGEVAPQSEPFAWTEDELEQISTATQTAGLDVRADVLLSFIADATVGREEAKFIASRTISDALKLITIWGAAQGLTRETLSYMTLGEILSLRGEADAGARAYRVAEAGAASYAADSTVLVPDVITGPEDLDVVTYVSSQPNFSGAGHVVSPPIVVEPGATSGDISGRVVLIESADPGFDWILTRGIAGLVTRYGGAASHMAIRCAEFGIPAAIGVGARFDALTRAARVDLDPSNQRVEALA